MSLDIFKKRLKENNPCGTYLFYGKEEYTKDFYARELRKKITLSPLPEFNYIIFDAAVSDPSELSEAVFSLPYMWEYKLIEVKNLDLASLDSDTAEEYKRVISELPEYIILMFLFRSEELDDGLVEGNFYVKKPKSENTKSDSIENDDSDNAQPAQKGKGKGIRIFIDAIKKDGLTINFPNEIGEKLENWILKHFSARKTECDRSAIQTLISLCGNDMYTLHSEIEKLICSPAQRPISQAAVLQYCCPNESYKVYELSDALNSGDMKKVKQIYDNLIENKTDPSLLLGYLSKCYSDMLIIKAAVEEGKSHSKIAQIMKKNEWLVRRIASGLSQKPNGYLAYACEEIDRADRKLKRFSVSPYLVLEILLFRIGLYGRK
ncbi:MAG: hypothetical protein A2Y15_07015 [Clostridiales bacterium GWF2_36_10]|nr:MAG: hypothetical protein A2Y15_07015 [Clostridiales bacterium GWF2_36_10]HAN21364.1 hypothetical protein [Clostridiales bacterium]